MRFAVPLFVLLITSSSCGHVLADAARLFIASPANPPAIYTCTMDLETGAFGALEVAAGDVRSGFMAWHPKLPILYAASRETVAKGEQNGAVRAYKVLPNGKLELLGQQSTLDNGTTHIEVDQAGKQVLVCHYGGMGTTAIALAADGSFTGSATQIKHVGSSVHPQRQTQPHPHGVAIHKDGRFVCVADLGNDHVEVFKLDGAAKIAAHSFWKSKPGAGPRHVSFHQNHRWLYCINELDSTISVLDFDVQQGKLTEVQTLTTLPQEFKEWNSTAEVVVHPSGKFLYGSNRGHNSTAVFSIDQKTGKLTFVEREPTQGDHPRFVGLESSGRIYISANMKSDNLVSFHIDQTTGELKATGNKLEVTRPMCVLFTPVQ